MTALPIDGVESSVFELASKDGDYRLLFWRGTSEATTLDVGDKTCNATHVDWWGMQLKPVGTVTGKVSLHPPAGADSVLQLLC